MLKQENQILRGAGPLHIDCFPLFMARLNSTLRHRNDQPSPDQLEIEQREKYLRYLILDIVNVPSMAERRYIFALINKNISGGKAETWWSDSILGSLQLVQWHDEKSHV